MKYADYANYTINHSIIDAHNRGEKTYIDDIWQSVVAELPEQLRAEALTKGYVLEDSPEHGVRSYHNYLFAVPGASPELASALEGTYRAIVCMHE